MRIGIITVTFNVAYFIQRQIDSFGKYTKGELIVVDNSDNLDASNNVRQICKGNGVKFIKTLFNEKDSSKSHGYACNCGLAYFKEDYDVLFFVDHDLFPVKEVDLEALIEGYKVVGVPQFKDGNVYFWPGCVMMRTDLDVDFMPRPGLDTGAGFVDIVNSTPQEEIGFMDEVNTEEFSRIYDGSFIHFRNGSNWKKDPKHDLRVSKLIQLL